MTEVAIIGELSIWQDPFVSGVEEILGELNGMFVESKQERRLRLVKVLGVIVLCMFLFRQEFARHT